ncbi:MAG: glycosyltransferase [Cyclobacteriaceae bacterium]|nr:glycosyltransferase [Cyclobacteriaceae bacterium]
MERSVDKKPVVLHYNSRYLPLTENWIHSILRHHKMFQPVFITRKIQNRHLFPLQEVYSFESRSKVIQIAQLIFSKLFGYIPFFYSISKSSGASVLHVHFGYQGVKLIGLKKKTGLPMVCSFYGDDAFHYPLKRGVANQYRKLFKEADRILALGPYMKNHLIALGCDEKKISIHHLGIDAGAIVFKPRHRKPGEPVRFMISCSLLEKKGVGIAIRALAGLKNNHAFTLDLVGDGPLRVSLQQLAAQLGVADRLTWHGYRPYSFVIEKMYQCDVLIQASITTPDNRKEGTPVAIMDAMATGMAVVATRHSDIPEIVEDGVTGLLAEENDVVSLQACFQKIIDYPEMIEKFGSRGREKVEREFNVAVLTEQLEVHYQEVIS